MSTTTETRICLHCRHWHLLHRGIGQQAPPTEGSCVRLQLVTEAAATCGDFKGLDGEGERDRP